jgi:hypothetical protein
VTAIVTLETLPERRVLDVVILTKAHDETSLCPLPRSHRFDRTPAELETCRPVVGLVCNGI